MRRRERRRWHKYRWNARRRLIARHKQWTQFLCSTVGEQLEQLGRSFSCVAAAAKRFNDEIAKTHPSTVTQARLERTP